MRLVLLRHRVVRVVGGQHRDPGPARQLDQLRVQPRLLGHAVVLDLDEEVVVAQDGPIRIGRLRRRLLVALRQAPQDLAAQAGRCADQPLAVLRQQLLVDARLVVVAVEVRLGDERHQVAVADQVLGQQDHVVVVRVRLPLPVGVTAGAT